MPKNDKLLIVSELDEITQSTNFIINMPIDNLNWFEDITGKRDQIYKGILDDEKKCLTNIDIKGLEFYHTYSNKNIMENEYYNLDLSIHNFNADERTFYICIMLVNDNDTDPLMERELIIIKDINLKYKVLGKYLKDYNKIRFHMHTENPYWIPKKSIGLDIFNIYI